ncbi:MAG: YebC/PmpR family DNA-binding transcriptional regulator [Acidobacteria bacterium]|nr:YebC/PmpR family DNA-binding transcriptional regulator [Acidobacteriota bacterium]
MSGHSKWASIKRKKAVTDARRGQLWTRLLKEITVAARLGGGDPEGNARLRVAVQEAKGANVPSDNIDRAIKRGTGTLEGVSYEEVSYEGYGPGGAAILVEAVTDNRNRTVAEIRHAFSRNGGSLGDSGCVSWMFDKRGYVAFEKSSMTEEQFMELALELNVDDLSSDQEGYEIFTSPESYLDTREAAAASGFEPAAGEISMIPQSYVELSDEHAKTVIKLIESLEELDDVQNVWSNVNLDAALATAN